MKTMNIVFTGKLEETRKEIEAMCDNAGITIQKMVTYETDILFVGARAQHFVDAGRKLSAKESSARRKYVEIKHITSINEILEYFI